MTTQKRSLPLFSFLVAALLLPPATALAKGQGFKAITRHLESHYHAKRKRIPLLGVANFAVKIVRPAGVKGFKIAVYEDQDFSRTAEDTSFDQMMREAMAKGWQPLVRQRSRRDGGGERFYLYTQAAGKDTKLITVAVESRQAVVVEARVDQQALAKFIERPEIMGKSLAGALSGGPSLVDWGSGKVNSRGDRGSQPTSLESLARKADRPPQPADPNAGSKPVLRTRSDDENGSAPPQPGSGEELLASAKYVPPKPPDKDVLRLETRLVNLNVKVTDRAGRPISNLKQENFAVAEDGVPQEVAFFQPVTAPINLVLLLDLSGSTKEKRKVMAQAAKKFIDSLGPNDRVALAAFTRQFYALSDFTTDRKELKKLVDKIKGIDGGTAFYDAMWSTLDLLDRVKEARKAIVVLTDGVDNSLQRSGRWTTTHTFDELLGRVSEEDATIYPIYLNTEPEIKINLKGKPWAYERRRERVAARKRPYEIAREQLEAIAEETAGLIFKADSEHDLDGVYQRVAAELHQLYSLAYDPKNTNLNGQFRKVGVKVNQPGLLARSRRGYYAK